MRKRLLGSIAALATGAGAAFGQAQFSPPPGYGDVVPASGHVSGLIPPQLGGPLPAGDAGPGAAPVYPPPGFYGAAATPSGAGGNILAPHVWVNTEYLLWFVRAQPTRQPYVTTGAPSNGTGVTGVAGLPSTTLLYSDRDLGYDLFSGFRISGGSWCSPDRRYGFELGGFLLEQKANSYFAGSDQNGLPVLARPFTTETGLPAALVVADLDNARGNLLVITRSQMYGVEANGLVNFYRSCPGEGGCPISVSGLLGFRYLELEESLQFSSASTLLAAQTFATRTVLPPATIGVRDEFLSTNRFYGGQLGMKGEAYCGNWVFGLTGKVAAGVMNERIDIRGRSEVIDPTRGVNTVVLGGLYANQQNIGRYRNDEFAVIPEGTATVGYQVTPGLSVNLGYNFLYINRVSRPGNLIPPRVNTASLPTFGNFGGTVVPLPNPALTQDEFWVQGATISILVKY